MNTQYTQQAEEEYSGDLYDNITFGYDPVACTVDTDCFTLNNIDIENLHVIGAGQSGVVMSDGQYAIKIGSIDRHDINKLEHAARHGYAPPIYYYEEDAILPLGISNALLEQEIWRYGEITSAYNYITLHGESDDTIYTADIAVLGKAEPLVDHDRYDEELEKEYLIAFALQEKCSFVDIYFVDCHPFNVGWYNGGLVILDL